ncbi:hypothetical protein [Paraliomyxa miuraensis]|uniref:hypothetical protein n=1 Tax=Paraliomyxa miuraensis TaxID=376150 RepID=UPI002250AA45|nr:hypothetical protein [Paraliomyxa miuraensis]MCX4245884.1 hypothetical protein [Paraliomyxa miuraensis]
MTRAFDIRCGSRGARLARPTPVRTMATRVLPLLALLVAAWGGVACAPGRSARAPEGKVTDTDANRYIRRAIRQSSEGVILLPSQRAEQIYELPRLNEIAQTLRGPAARCFLTRAIETMEAASGETSGEDERGYLHVPEGQMKVRVRIAPSGEVLRTEVLESGFVDEQMEPCVRKVLEDQRWPPNKSGNSHFVDVVYWVSLGMQRDLHTEAMVTHLRREQIGAGRRGKACLQGRVDAGRYEVRGLNLVDREGGTLVNRIDTKELPESIRACLAAAFHDIRLPRDPDAFVRPVAPSIAFEIGNDGTVMVEGEEWLELVELEERARRAAEREALRVEDPSIDEMPPHRPAETNTGLSLGAAGGGGGTTKSGAGQGTAPADSSGTDAPPSTEPPADQPTTDEPREPGKDPGKGGLRLDLSPGQRRGDGA